MLHLPAQLVLLDLKVTKVVKVDKVHKVLKVQQALHPPAVVVTKVQLELKVLKDLPVI
jgi:hypothetical protein